jgi:lysophospholipase L1-like esterase
MTSPEPRIFSRYPKTTIALVVIVFFLAMDLSAGAFLIPADPAGFRRPHHYYHHGLAPNRSQRTIWEDRVIPEYTNSLGFLDTAVRDVPLVAGGRRVLLMGDSVTEGFGVAFDQSFAGILAAELAAEGIEVLNAAVLSYSPKLYYLKTKYLIEEVGLGFDALYVLIDISDVQDEFIYEAFEPQAYDPFDTIAFRIQKLLKTRSFAYYAIANLAQQVGGAAHFSVGVHNWVEELESYAEDRPGFGDVRKYWTVDAAVFEKWGERGLRLAAENMQRLVRLCKAHGIEMTIVVYPWPTQVRERDVDSIQARFWESFTRHFGIRFINLFPTFIRDGTDPEEVIARYYFPDDPHWNRAGHRLVADRLMAHMRAGDS